MKFFLTILGMFFCLMLGACSDDTQTQMIVCAANNDKKCIQSYLESGEDPNGKGKEGVSPFLAALVNNNFGIADIYLKYGVKLDGKSSGDSYIYILISAKNYAALDYLRDVGAKYVVDSKEHSLAKEIGDMALLQYFEQ